jgi:thioester reductase-like protein
LAEAALDDSIRPDPAAGEPVLDPSNIFLTGGTGFLGSFLIEELLRRTDATLYCLVRSSDAEEGAKRLRRVLEANRLWDDRFASRIVPVVGDLSLPRFGLSEQAFASLAERVEAVYHSGALVNFIFPYSALKGANVDGTREVLRLACAGRAKPLHYVSTISVFSGRGGAEPTVFRETDEVETFEPMRFGYPQSKWVAEKMVRTARERGLPVVIYRPGLVAGSSRTGVANTDDFSYRFLRGCVELGSVPEAGTQVDVVPVDYVTRAIVHLSRRADSFGRAFHLVNPRTLGWAEALGWLTRAGYALRRLSYNEWREELERHPENYLYTLLPVLPAKGAGEQLALQETPAPAREVVFDTTNTAAALGGTGIECPPVGVELLDTYLTYLVESGFLDAPSAKMNVAVK